MRNGYKNNTYGNLVKFPRPKRTLKTNVVYCADNLEVMRQLPSESIDLIYIDPPFGTQSLRKSKAWSNEVQGLSFYDSYGGGIKSYVSFMSDRLEQMHRLLKPSGVLCVHLDWRSVHYIKCKMDEIFDYNNLINSIVWYYSGGASSKKSFSKKHDDILVYSKTKNYNFYSDKIRVPYEGNGGYQNSKGIINRGKRYRPNPLGKIPTDVFKIPIIHPNDTKERIGYPTQKPLKLLKIFIKAFTEKDQVVADFFCGCGTTISAAEGLGRKWLGVDASKEASKVIRKRMARDHKLKIEITPLKNLNKAEVLRLNPFEFESYCVRCVGGIPNEKQRSDGGIDGKLIYDGTPIQVKKSPNIGRPVIDAFHKHLRKNGRGIIIALSFGRGAKEEAQRLKVDEGKDLQLITLDKILSEGTSSVA